MRGKGGCALGVAQNARITPAYAGKRWTGETATVNVGDHPRLCGEKGICGMLKPGIQGSPPPMRGKVLRHFFHKLRIGDHPRLCGEKLLILCTSCNRKGSPPPMRGKVYNLSGTVDRTGITPAYAGKRLWCCIHQKLRWDHPRLCGEKFGGWDASIRALGSPPPMRGKAFKAACATPTDRITPAYAGKSAISFRCSCLWRDHPRLCGEKWCLGNAAMEMDRITPAYAGKRFPR